jgi:hypothetical protein
MSNAFCHHITANGPSLPVIRIRPLPKGNSKQDDRSTKEAFHLDKKTYYVSVGSGDIVREEGSANFEFEIQATDEELNELEELFEEKEEADNGSARRALTPYYEYHNDGENDAYDTSLGAIYKLIHKLGTTETKNHIESMNLN